MTETSNIICLMLIVPPKLKTDDLSIELQSDNGTTNN